MAKGKTLEELGIGSDGVCYWVGPHLVRRQRGDITPRGQNGFTAEQIKAIAADISKQEKKDG